MSIITEKDLKELNGLRGWLSVVGFTIIVSIPVLGYQVINLYMPILIDGTLTHLLSFEAQSFNRFLAYLVIGEFLCNSFIVLLFIYLAYLFFTKSPKFPKLYIFILLFRVVFLMLDLLIFALISPEPTSTDPETQKVLIQSIIVACVWVPYMLKSKRVRITFKAKEIEQKIIKVF